MSIKCSTCGVYKPEGEYHKNRARRTGRQSRCKRCQVTGANERYSTDADFRARKRALAKQWRLDNPEEFWANQLRARMGITVDHYMQMFEQQGGHCALCPAVPSDIRRLSVDHDHACCPGIRSCGKCVRALLCDNCNRGLGLFQDSPERLRAAASYLEVHRVTAN